MALPVGARSVGHYRFDRGFHSNVKTVHWVQVFWGVSGTGVVMMNGREYRLGPGQVALYLPGMEHCYYSTCEEWEFRWWTMDGPLAVPMVASYGLRDSKIYDAGPPPANIFEQLRRALLDVTSMGERRASVLAYELISRAAAGHRTDPTADPLVVSAISMIEQEWNNTSVGVTQIADRLNVHRSVLSRRFQAILGISPTRYLINLRVRNALGLLKTTHVPISQVARECGWTDSRYFSRCIRHATGCSPRTFREQ